MINQDLKNNYKNYKNILGLVFCMDKTQTPKRKSFFVFLFEILIDHIHSKNKNNTIFVFHFRTKITKETREKQKNHLLSENHTFSQKFWFFVLLVLLEFFVCFCFFYWFTWLPSVSLCLLAALSVLGSQILTKVSYSRACALCETKLGIGRAVMFMPYALEHRA